MAMTTSRLTPRTLLARSSSFSLPSGLTTAGSKSNPTVAAKVTFSAAGFGFGAGGGGAGLTSGAGAGGGAGGGAGFGGSCVAHPAANANATRSSQLFLIILPPVPKTFSYQERSEEHTSELQSR